MDRQLQQISSRSLLRNMLKFSNNSYISDNGWILENEIKQDYTGMKSLNIEFNQISPFFPNSLYWVSISTPQIKNTTYRSYIKLPELAAKIGGIINIMLIISNCLFSNYFNYLFLLSLQKYLVNFDISQDSTRNLFTNLNVKDSNINRENININISKFSKIRMIMIK